MTCNLRRDTLATFRRFQKQPAFGIMLQRKIAANRTYSADSAGRRSETDTEKPLQCSEIICCLSNINFLRCKGHPMRCNGHSEHRNRHPTRFLTWKSHGNFRLLEQQNITLICLNAATLCSSVTTQCFALLLAQQNITTRISNHLYHKHLAFGECAGVWSVCIGVLFHCDG